MVSTTGARRWATSSADVTRRCTSRATAPAICGRFAITFISTRIQGSNRNNVILFVSVLICWEVLVNFPHAAHVTRRISLEQFWLASGGQRASPGVDVLGAALRRAWDNAGRRGGLARI